MLTGTIANPPASAILKNKNMKLENYPPRCPANATAQALGSYPFDSAASDPKQARTCARRGNGLVAQIFELMLG